MDLFPLLAVGLLMNIVAVLFVITAVVLILIVLIQRGKGGGLGGAFGGAMGGGVLGSKTGDFLTWLTISLAAVFLFLAVIMAKFYRPSVTEMQNAAQQQQQEQTMPESTDTSNTQPSAGMDMNTPSR